MSDPRYTTPATSRRLHEAGVVSTTDRCWIYNWGRPEWKLSALTPAAKRKINETGICGRRLNYAEHAYDLHDLITWLGSLGIDVLFGLNDLHADKLGQGIIRSLENGDLRLPSPATAGAADPDAPLSGEGT